MERRVADGEGELARCRGGERSERKSGREKVGILYEHWLVLRNIELESSGLLRRRGRCVAQGRDALPAPRAGRARALCADASLVGTSTTGPKKSVGVHVICDERDGRVRHVDRRNLSHRLSPHCLLKSASFLRFLLHFASSRAQKVN